MNFHQSHILLFVFKLDNLDQTLVLYVDMSVPLCTACFLNSWTGEEALRELQEASISEQSFPILKQCVAGVIFFFFVKSFN